QYEQASYSEVSWLKDGSALLLDLRTKQTGGGETFFEIEAVIHFDPVTGEFTPVEGLDLEALSEDPSQLMAALEAQGWEAATDTHLSGVQIVPPDSYYGTAPESCATWEIADVTTDENGVRTLDPVYTVDGVFQLTDLTNLTNESKLFLQWTMPDCRLNMPTIALVKLMPDGEAKVLAEGVFPGLRIGRDRSFVDALVSNRVSVSPDQRYAAWIGGSLDTGTSTLNVIDLETGENRVIQQEAGTGSGSGFVETQVITAVYWMGE
ncbi:MAG TPA: hypothetical protein VHP83_11135, partial [Aggregatilineaceae bacterium]|nr:hypothetical protein [Aggregatilineaceae bacterium]